MTPEPRVESPRPNPRLRCIETSRGPVIVLDRLSCAEADRLGSAGLQAFRIFAFAGEVDFSPLAIANLPAGVRPAEVCQPCAALGVLHTVGDRRWQRLLHWLGWWP